MTDTSIQWTDKVWNPVRGCALVSPGCTNCYAMKQAHRFAGKGGPYASLTKATSHGPVWTGEARVVPDILTAPLRWKRPARVFVNSMSDLFHEDVPDSFIDQVFAVMALAPRHTFQILTKRARRMREYVSDGGRAATVFNLVRTSELGYCAHGEDLPPQSWPLPNVWLAARRYSFLWPVAIAIAVCLAVYLLAACATTPAPPKPLLLVYESCGGKTEFVEVEFRVSAAPAVDCVRLAPSYGVNPMWLALQLPVACALRQAERALIVLPLLAPIAMIVHELRHVMGEVHSPLLPFPMWCP